jgi:hypothetical protein
MIAESPCELTKPRSRSLGMFENLRLSRNKKSSSKKSVRQIDATTGDPDRVKKESSSKTAVQSSRVFSLWNLWKVLLRGKLGYTIPREEMSGSDFGHFRNLLRFCNDFDRAKSIIEKIVEDWVKVKASFPVASKRVVPDPYLVDCLKGDLLAVIQGAGIMRPNLGGAHRGDSAESGKFKEDDYLPPEYRNADNKK